MNDKIPDGISVWADVVAEQLVLHRIELDFPRRLAVLHAATIDVSSAYESIVALSRLAGALLRPDGHRGGPIGVLAPGIHDPLLERAGQLIGFAAQRDAGMVDALARATLSTETTTNPLLEARTLLWAIVEIIAIEPIREKP